MKTKPEIQDSGLKRALVKCFYDIVECTVEWQEWKSKRGMHPSDFLIMQMKDFTYPDSQLSLILIDLKNHLSENTYAFDDIKFKELVSSHNFENLYYRYSGDDDAYMRNFHEEAFDTDFLQHLNTTSLIKACNEFKLQSASLSTNEEKRSLDIKKKNRQFTL